MNRPARTLTRDLVRRRHPTGASPSRRNAPGRTLSPMPSEQKGAYGGHLALLRQSSRRKKWLTEGPSAEPFYCAVPGLVPCMPAHRGQALSLVDGLTRLAHYLQLITSDLEFFGASPQLFDCSTDLLYGLASVLLVLDEQLDSGEGIRTLVQDHA